MNASLPRYDLFKLLIRVAVEVLFFLNVRCRRRANSSNKKSFEIHSETVYTTLILLFNVKMNR